MIVLLPDPLGPLLVSIAELLMLSNSTYNEGCDFVRWYLQRVIVQDSTVGAAWIAETDILELDGARKIIRDFARCLKRIDARSAINKSEEFSRSRSGASERHRVRRNGVNLTRCDYDREQNTGDVSQLQ